MWPPISWETEEGGGWSPSHVYLLDAAHSAPLYASLSAVVASRRAHSSEGVLLGFERVHGRIEGGVSLWWIHAGVRAAPRTFFSPPRRSGAEDAELLFLAYVSLSSVRAERLWKSQQAFTRRLRGFQINRF